MIQIEETIIRQLVLHRISTDANKSILDSDLPDYSNENEEIALKKIFLKPFLSQALTYEFKHEIDLEYNVLFKLSRQIYEGDDFVEKSKSISQHLISTSKHPNIKDGDLFIVKFDDIKLNNKYYEGLGIYKFEDKESFIETSIIDKKVSFNFRNGIGNKKPDKACLIIFTEIPYTLLIIDNGSTETDYWQNEFIKHKPKNDFVNNTNNFLSLTKSFITEQIPNEYAVGKADQIDLLNRTVNYFKNNETFDKKDFEDEVFQNKDIIKSFRNFDETFREKNEFELSDTFEISPQAVKKQAKIFKSVLKLDKNFHIYIHGDKELIEQGVEQDGRKFYKIYYQIEN
jgi:hypothetical protein